MGDEIEHGVLYLKRDAIEKVSTALLKLLNIANVDDRETPPMREKVITVKISDIICSNSAESIGVSGTYFELDEVR